MPKRPKNEGPFNPQFGKRPKTFIGRSQIISELIDGYYDLSSPLRTTVISGVRGSGKTSLLSDISELLSKEKEWIVVDTTLSTHLLENILNQLQDKISKKLPKLQSLNFNLAGFGLGVTLERAETRNFQTTLLNVCQALTNQGIGVLFTLDEIKPDPQLQEFAATYQLLVRKNLDVVLLMAGLPQFVLKVLTDDVLTFLQRANKVFLRNIDLYTFKAEYLRVFTKSGKKFSEEALDLAYLSTEGYPYLFQLIGYNLWSDSDTLIDLTRVEKAIEQSKPFLFQNVYQLSLADLSPGEKKYLLALAEEGGKAKMSDLVERLHKTASYLSQYRKFLVDRGLIESQAFGHVQFTLPFFKEFMLENSKQERR